MMLMSDTVLLAQLDDALPIPPAAVGALVRLGVDYLCRTNCRVAMLLARVDCLLVCWLSYLAKFWALASREMRPVLPATALSENRQAKPVNARLLFVIEEEAYLAVFM